VLKIAVTGAPLTGKRQLAAALASALKTSGHEATVAVTDAESRPAELCSFELTLVMGLEDAPLRRADQAAGECQQPQHDADLSIRAALSQAGIPYRVMYGTAEQRLAQALEAAQSLRPRAPAFAQSAPGIPSKPRESRKAWTWACEKCSDPVCEHRLLSDLLARRAAAIA
jgi:hypothetical protein